MHPRPEFAGHFDKVFCAWRNIPDSHSRLAIEPSQHVAAVKKQTRYYGRRLSIRFHLLQQQQTNETNMPPPKKVKKVMTMPINVIFSYLQVSVKMDGGDQ